MAAAVPAVLASGAGSPSLPWRAQETVRRCSSQLRHPRRPPSQHCRSCHCVFPDAPQPPPLHRRHCVFPDATRPPATVSDLAAPELKPWTFRFGARSGYPIRRPCPFLLGKAGSSTCRPIHLLGTSSMRVLTSPIVTRTLPLAKLHRVPDTPTLPIFVGQGRLFHMPALPPPWHERHAGADLAHCDPHPAPCKIARHASVHSKVGISSHTQQGDEKPSYLTGKTKIHIKIST